MELHYISYIIAISFFLSIQVSADDKVPVETLPIRQPFFVKPGLRLLEMLSIFREGRCHLALVTDDPITAMKCMEEGKRPSSESSNVIGIVTLEDVIEEILQGDKFYIMFIIIEGRIFIDLYFTILHIHILLYYDIFLFLVILVQDPLHAISFTIIF